MTSLTGHTVLMKAAPVPEFGPWIVQRELGRGGMGATYAVVHDRIGKRAALKVVVAPGAAVEAYGERFLLEAQVVNRIRHPGVIDIFDVGVLPDGRCYVVMELLDGETLADRVARTRLLPDEAIAILLGICEPLRAAHAAGVIHRDLKPDNIFLVGGGPAPQVKLIDWGIAKLLDDSARRTGKHQVLCTPQYVAPEHARGQKIGPQVDVYSLGVIAYELFLEMRPFEADTNLDLLMMHVNDPPPPPRELWPGIPRALEQLMLAMLAKHPQQRPSLDEVIATLGALRVELAGRRVTSPGGPPAAVAVAVPNAPTQPHVAPRRWLLAVAALAAAIVASLYDPEMLGGQPRAGRPAPAPAPARVVEAPVAVEVEPPPPPPSTAMAAPGAAAVVRPATRRVAPPPVVAEAPKPPKPPTVLAPAPPTAAPLTARCGSDLPPRIALHGDTSAAAVAALYQRVGQELAVAQRDGLAAAAALFTRYRLIRLDDAIATADARRQTIAALDQLDATLRRRASEAAAGATASR